MKKIISVVLISTTLFTSSFAYSNNNEKPGNTVRKEVAIKSPFQSIKISSNLQLVLMQGADRSNVIIAGDENLVQGVNINIEKGILFITSKKNLKNKDVKIYVPVSMLNSLELGSGASVTTEGVVMLDDLKVLVHDGSKVMLRVLGNFEIEGAEDCDVVYEKYEKANVVFVKR